MKANKITVILGVIVVMIAIISALMMSDSLGSFIHIPAVVLVVLVAGGLGLTSYRGGGLVSYIDVCKKYFISAGVLGTIMGIIMVLTRIEDPSNWGPGAGAALLSVFYGIVFYCITDALVAGSREV